jgi:DNA-binding transcriptional LysR family regulator
MDGIEQTRLKRTYSSVFPNGAHMLNYRHLHYFWVVTKEGGFARAAERLDMAVQTISAQVRELEKALGHQLLKPSGRGVALTEAGQAAFARAEEIFQLGQGIPDEVREAASGKVARLAVGLLRWHLQAGRPCAAGARAGTANLRLVCHEGEFEQLLGELALHHLDLVLAGQAAPRNPNLRLTSERLVDSPVEWYGPARLVGKTERDRFPQSLNDLPVLLPTGPLGAAPDAGSLVRGAGPAAPHRRRVRGQRAAGGVRGARAGRVPGQPARRGRRRPDARAALAGQQRWREGGDPRHPLAPRPAPPLGDAGGGCGSPLNAS